MDTITLTYDGQHVALVGRERFWLAAHIEALPDGHADKRHVCFMALYARNVLTGELPVPYSDDDADRFARLALKPTPARQPRRASRVRPVYVLAQLMNQNEPGGLALWWLPFVVIGFTTIAASYTTAKMTR